MTRRRGNGDSHLLANSQQPRAYRAAVLRLRRGVADDIRRNDFYEFRGGGRAVQRVARHANQQVRVHLPCTGDYRPDIALDDGPFAAEMSGGRHVNLLGDGFHAEIVGNGKLNGVFAKM